MKNLEKIEKTTEILPVKLTQEEIIENAKKLAKATNDLRDAETRKAEVVSQLTADCKRLKSAADSLSLLISNGYEYRNIECELIYDFNKGTKTLTRIDTGEIVRTVEISIEERQGTFSYTEGSEIKANRIKDIQRESKKV